jgi:hypothetical protein
LLNPAVQLSDAERADLAGGLQATLGREAIAPQAVVTPPPTGSAVLLATLGTALAGIAFALGRSRALNVLFSEHRDISARRIT